MFLYWKYWRKKHVTDLIIMMLKLRNYSNAIKLAVKENILSNINVLDNKQRTILYNAFCHYVPNKERAYIINRIAHCYSIDRNLTFLLESGMELIFAAYYLRDDLLDETPTILGQSVNKYSAKTFSLYADILDEVGNMQIAKYCAEIGKPLRNFIFEGFLCLSNGQMQGLNNIVGTEDYLDIAYNKNGAMMEYALKMLLPLLPDDGNILIDFATDFGVSSQIRNDIEDYLRNDNDTLFQDIKTKQVNFVLSAYYDRTQMSFDNEIVYKNSSKDIIETLSADISFAIRFLSAFKAEMLNRLSYLSNHQCSKELKEITNKIITLQ